MTGAAIANARELGLRGCHDCGMTFEAAGQHGSAICPRCGAHSVPLIPHSLQRTWAYLIASTILYIPANVLPIFRTVSLGEVESHTILGGVVELARGGAWDLAAIVFVASVVVPVLKIATLAMLALSSVYRPHWRRQQRARLYRMVETIGHWSMLDIFVVVLLVALVQFGTLMTIEPGGAAAAFGGVVVMTMLASTSFDPRLIWADPSQWVDRSQWVESSDRVASSTRVDPS